NSPRLDLCNHDCNFWIILEFLFSFDSILASHPPNYLNILPLRLSDHLLNRFYLTAESGEYDDLILFGIVVNKVLENLKLTGGNPLSLSFTIYLIDKSTTCDLLELHHLGDDNRSIYRYILILQCEEELLQHIVVILLRLWVKPSLQNLIHSRREVQGFILGNSVGDGIHLFRQPLQVFKFLDLALPKSMHNGILVSEGRESSTEDFLIQKAVL